MHYLKLIGKVFVVPRRLDQWLKAYLSSTYHHGIEKPIKIAKKKHLKTPKQKAPNFKATNLEMQ